MRRLPHRLRLSDRELRFVGRAAESATLRQVWSEVRGGGLRAALIGGQPGIGKTRIAAHLAQSVTDDGGRVLYGRSDPELAIPLQAFAEAFSDFAEHASDARLDALGRSAPSLARIVPALGDYLVRAGGQPAEPRPAEQHELLQAGSKLLEIASAEQPLLLILDDVQWADRATAQMLRYLVANPARIEAMILVTYRTTDLDPGSHMASTLVDLERQPNAIDLVLEGLSRENSIELAGEHQELAAGDRRHDRLHPVPARRYVPRRHPTAQALRLERRADTVCGPLVL